MIEVNNEKQPVKRRKKKRKSFLGYLIFFLVVFFVCLFGMSYLVKSYSPDVDVAIGNNEAMTLTETDMDVEVKPIDERLKWIKMEDEMPSVAIREAKEDTENTLKEKKKKNKVEMPVDEEPIFKKKEVVPTPSIAEVIPQTSDFRNVSTQVSTPVIPAPIPSLTKVYLGEYSSVDEAMSVQQKVASEIPESMPFIKSVNGSYIVQLGSFSNKDIADNFILKVKEKGYSPKVLLQN